MARVDIIRRRSVAAAARRRQTCRSSSTVGAARALSAVPAPRPGDDGLLEPKGEGGSSSLVPIDFATSSRISGEESQILEVRLEAGQMLRAESGSMLYMTEGVEMETSMGLGDGPASSLSTALTRTMTGQNLMVSDFRYVPRESDGKHAEHGTVGLGTDFPAKILRIDLDDFPESKLICQKGAFLAGSHTVQMEMAYTKSFSSGFFG